jgi:hypothetical protein
MLLHVLTRLYRIILRLYPVRFRAEFAEEMESVFEEAVSEAAQHGALAAMGRALAELASLPGAAFQLRQGSRPPALGWEGPPSAKETLVALGIFVLPAVNLFLDDEPLSSSGLIPLGIAALLVAAFITGLYRGFPRWSLPYLGLALSAINFIFVFQRAADWIVPSMLSHTGLEVADESSLLVVQALWAGMMWLSLFAITFLALCLLALLRRFRPMIARIRQDWTLVSYILYCGALFTLGFAFGGHRSERLYTLASSLCLLTGAWLYLRSARSWQRTLALLAGLSLAMWAAIASQWPVELVQDWGGWLQAQPLAQENWLATRQAILAWMWMVLTLLAPALLKLLPGTEPRAPSTS